MELILEVKPTGDSSAPWGLYVGDSKQPIMKGLTEMYARLLKAAFIAGYFYKKGGD